MASIDAPGRKGGLRPLDIANEADQRLLLEALDRRTPVSHTLGLKADWHAFTFSWGTDAVYACDALDCLLVMEVEGERLNLYDIIGSTLPSISDLAEVLPKPVSEIAFYFTPDQFDVDARPQPYRYEGDVFMVRGPFVAENNPVMAPVTSRH